MSAEPELDRIAEDYLRRLRRSMRGATPDVVGEAEREIRGHIEDAMRVRDRRSVGALLDVLDRLGPPEDYGRDLALYMMVETGYRRWSVHHMVRSTLFWALSTVVGGVVVLLFGLLYALGFVMVGVGLLEMLGGDRAGQLLPRPLTDASPPALALLGVILLLLLTALVRWFVGQYVRRARPHTIVGAAGADDGWVDRTSRRILAAAAAGFVVTVVAGVASGALQPDALAGLRRPPDFLASPLAFVSGLGLALLLLAPVVGVLWTVIVERRGEA